MLLIVSSLFAGVSVKSPKIKGDDLKRLTGERWTGTLTYLDYGRNKKVSIPSNLVVIRSAENKRTWIFEFQYPNEPQANSKRTLTIGADGRTFGEETIVARTTLADKTLKIVTEKKGTDNDKQALFRFTYLLSATNFSIKKEVRYEGASDFFERNEYTWRR
jgi:hypothetical protein